MVLSVILTFLAVHAAIFRAVYYMPPPTLQTNGTGTFTSAITI